MNEQDRRVVESGRAALESGAFDMYKDTMPETSIKALIAIIDRLDAENKKLKAELDRAVNALVKS